MAMCGITEDRGGCINRPDVRSVTPETMLVHRAWATDTDDGGSCQYSADAFWKDGVAVVRLVGSAVPVPVQRVAWRRWFGNSPPADAEVATTCGNPECVERTHLELATPGD